MDGFDALLVHLESADVDAYADDVFHPTAVVGHQVLDLFEYVASLGFDVLTVGYNARDEQPLCAVQMYHDGISVRYVVLSPLPRYRR